MTKSGGFEDLKVWQLSIGVTECIYLVTKNFPKEDFWGLGQDIRKTCYSVSSNIAEGASRTTDADYARFISIALGSNGELRSQIYIAYRLKLLPQDNFDAINAKLNEIGRMLKSLHRVIKTRSNNG